MCAVSLSEIPFEGAQIDPLRIRFGQVFLKLTTLVVVIQQEIIIQQFVIVVHFLALQLGVFLFSF